jgi:hypothetical protein
MLKLDTSSVKRSSNTCAWIWIRWHLQVSENCVEEESCCVQIHHWWLMVVPPSILFFSPESLDSSDSRSSADTCPWRILRRSARKLMPPLPTLSNTSESKKNVLSKIQHNTLEEDGRMHETFHTEGSNTPSIPWAMFRATPAKLKSLDVGRANGTGMASQ